MQQFIQDELRENDLVMDDAGLQKFIAVTVSNECGHKHIGIEDDLHDTRSKTS